MDIRDFIDDTARSVGFLSRLPVPDRFFHGYDGGMSRAVAAFPVAGALIALPAAALMGLLLGFGAEPLLAAMIALAVSTMVTGALHEDGLGDTADGIGGGRTRERALEIMRDSRIGSYGASALILSYGIRAAALASIGEVLSPAATFFSLVAIAALSRGAMVWHWSALPPARKDGVAASAGMPAPESLRIALLWTAILGIAFLWPTAGIGPAIATFVGTTLAVWAMTGFVRSKLGGQTGDTIGSSQQCAEIAALCGLALAI